MDRKYRCNLTAGTVVNAEPGVFLALQDFIPEGGRSFFVAVARFVFQMSIFSASSA
jgi:hypothetical protein